MATNTLYSQFCGIQIAQELISEQIGQPIVAHRYNEQIVATFIENMGRSNRISERSDHKGKGEPKNVIWDTNCRVIFEGLGNGVRPHEYNGVYR